MKAVIVEIRGNSAAALCDNGCVVRLKNRDYTVGQVIGPRPARKPLEFKLVSRIAYAVAAAAVITFSAWIYHTPYSYVSLDVNPSLAFSVNRFDRVLDCSAVNGDGEEIVNSLSLRNKGIEEAVRMTVQEIAAKGYLTNEATGDIVIAAFSENPDKSDALVQTLSQTATEAAAEKDIQVEIEAESVGQERVQAAEALGTTPGKLNIVEKLKESADDASSIDSEEWLKKPVKDIMRQIRENQGKSSSNAADPSAGADKDDAKASAWYGGMFPGYTWQSLWPSWPWTNGGASGSAAPGMNPYGNWSSSGQNSGNSQSQSWWGSGSVWSGGQGWWGNGQSGGGKDESSDQDKGGSNGGNDGKDKSDDKDKSSGKDESSGQSRWGNGQSGGKNEKNNKDVDGSKGGSNGQSRWGGGQTERTE